MLRVLVATSGSVASVKLPLIVEALRKHSDRLEVQVIATEHSLHFYNADKLPCRVWRDADEWKDWDKISDPIVHIELRRWADLIVVAPCSANTLAKIANGLCDNLLTSLLRAVDPSKTKVILCPAMNTQMWQHPLTAIQLSMVKDVLGYQIMGPVSKNLACGDDGMGAMSSWQEIVDAVVSAAG
ncbi:uncharacterized protein L969DRAFT_105187 [Mixia osmundae IAM 14324]|uniref:Flavoprotein domain-containing protein n=1 Tax=Mixia osmundae (strain CBS 9802 / IAM 14324 / JCM 22182 / KY 12970) TaxID=764103 RepID=G7DUW9_MIXOS|nr:uncharacterized protein L969DRAFT_105187 [Mixia osmundae IAM 14324]KEI37404.1 hypothetical protein L969DRAFT_105187 [Mixia osmundae IAM 14324]GAA94379.1 hypothetical protein E5Q_01030 [Mixia osmundae IAM 14324]